MEVWSTKRKVKKRPFLSPAGGGKGVDEAREAESFLSGKKQMFRAALNMTERSVWTMSDE